MDDKSCVVAKRATSARRRHEPGAIDGVRNQSTDFALPKAIRARRDLASLTSAVRLARLGTLVSLPRLSDLSRPPSDGMASRRIVKGHGDMRSSRSLRTDMSCSREILRTLSVPGLV